MGKMFLLLPCDKNFNESRCKTLSMTEGKKVLSWRSAHFPSTVHSRWSGASALLCHRSATFLLYTEGPRPPESKTVRRPEFISQDTVSEYSQSIHFPEQFKDGMAVCVYRQLRASFRILLKETCSGSFHHNDRNPSICGIT